MRSFEVQGIRLETDFSNKYIMYFAEPNCHSFNGALRVCIDCLRTCAVVIAHDRV